MTEISAVEKSPENLIARWTDFSRIFYDAFPLDRYQGLQWFFIEILLQEFGKRRSVDDLKEIVSGHKLVDNPNYYVPALLENLREHDFVYLADAKGKKLSQAFAKCASEDQVAFTQKFLNAVVKYVSNFCEANLGKKEQLADAQARMLMLDIYDFMLHDYIGIWRRLLRDISRIAVANSEESAKKLEGKLRDDSAVFVLIHSFWINFLSADNKPVTYNNAIRFGLKIREYSEPTLVACLELLSAPGGFLIKKGNGKRATYTLNRNFLDRLNLYTSELSECDGRLEQVLKSSLRKVLRISR